MRLRRLSLALLLVGPLACGGGVEARDQWTVWISTDVPVPTFADRALVEVLDTNGELACTDCRRQLGLPLNPEEWPISFGIAARPGSAPPRVRVRLYRARAPSLDGFPAVGTTLDRFATLPPARGDTDVQLALHGDCIGIGAELETQESCVGPDRGLSTELMLPVGKPAATFRPGTWARATSQPCTLSVGDDMVCVPGGFFPLGDAAAFTVVDLKPAPERFVTISPFAIDRAEVTVGAMRAVIASGRLSAEPARKAAVLSDTHAFCTYLGPTDSTNDGVPLNCVDHRLAEAFCALHGKRLPTEAEWEWVAGNLARETRFTWGDDGDPCYYADVARGLVGLVGSNACEREDPNRLADYGPRAGGQPRDKTALGVLALNGGVSEWMADRAAPYDAPCWQPNEPFLLNPRCEGNTGPFTLRGASWLDAPTFAEITQRQSGPAELIHLAVGFRCARSN